MQDPANRWGLEHSELELVCMMVALIALGIGTSIIGGIELSNLFWKRVKAGFVVDNLFTFSGILVKTTISWVLCDLLLIAGGVMLFPIGPAKTVLVACATWLLKLFVNTFTERSMHFAMYSSIALYAAVFNIGCIMPFLRGIVRLGHFHL